MSVSPVVFYHASCRDGQCAAWVARRALPNAELVPVQYGSEPPIDMARDREVYVIDFSWKRPEMFRLMSASSRTVVLDHHRTAEAELEGLERQLLVETAREHTVLFDMNRSGAGIAWDHFFPHEARPWPVEYVEDRDLWKWKLRESRAVNAHIATMDYAPESFDALSWDVESAITLGTGALAMVRSYADAACGNAHSIFLDGWRVPSVTACQHNISEVLERLLELNPRSAFVVGWWRRADGTFQYSLRSRQEFDVSVVAKKFGGGGHKNAAGFQGRDLI